MGQLWTDEMQADLERWQAIEEEAANPKDFLIVHDISMDDRLRGLARYAVEAITYWAVGGWKPMPLRQQIETANINRQIGPERLAESKAFLKEEHEPSDFDDFDWFDG